MFRVMMSTLLVALCATAASAGEPTCYQVSKDRARTAASTEVLCVEAVENSTDLQHVVTLRTSTDMTKTPVATMNLALLQKAQKPELNKDVLGALTPMNSALRAVDVVFDGKKDEGKVWVGKSKLYFKKLAK